MLHIPSTRAIGAMSVDEFCEWANIGRTLAYKEIASRRLATVKVGRRRIVPYEEAQRWLQSCLNTMSSHNL